MLESLIIFFGGGLIKNSNIIERINRDSLFAINVSELSGNNRYVPTDYKIIFTIDSLALDTKRDVGINIVMLYSKYFDLQGREINVNMNEYTNKFFLQVDYFYRNNKLYKTCNRKINISK